METLLPWLVMSNYSLDMKIFLPRLLMSNFRYEIVLTLIVDVSEENWVCSVFLLCKWVVPVLGLQFLLVTLEKLIGCYWMFFHHYCSLYPSDSLRLAILIWIELDCLGFESLLLLSVVEPAIMFVPELEAAGSTPHKHHNWAIWWEFGKSTFFLINTQKKCHHWAID